MDTSGDNKQEGAIPLVVTVGISGHRRPEQLGDPARTRALLQDTFRDLRASLTELNGPVRFVLLSPLAEGADRLFVDALREVEPDADLLVPLPFSRDAYEQSFEDPASVAEFRKRVDEPKTLECFVIPGGREGEYLRLGRWVVDNADIMFFLHDGSDFAAAPRDGGTSSVIQYAWADGDLPGSDDREGHPIYAYVDTADETVIVRGAARSNPHARHLAEGADAPFDERAQLHQRHFDRTVTTIVALAFLVGTLVLLDWFSDGNKVFACLGPLHRVINWDSLATLAVLALILRVFTSRNRNALRDWLESRYLAERRRTLPELLAADVPPSVVLAGRGRDPSSRDMARVWHSLYLSAREAFRATGSAPAAPDTLRTRLLTRDGFLADQINWHLKRAREKGALQRGWTWARNLLFVLSAAASAAAAVHVASAATESAVLANSLDLASSLLSLLLAGAATMGQVKEHGRVAAKYRDTARRLSEVRRTIRFVEAGDGPGRTEELRELVVEGTEVLMETTYAWMDTMKEKAPDLA